MSKNIHARLYIKFVLKVLIFGVRRPITQVNDHVGRDSSAARVSSRYVRKWGIEWWWLQSICLPASHWVRGFLRPEFL